MNDVWHVSAAGCGQLPDVTGDLGRGWSNSDDNHLRTMPTELISESIFSFHEPFDGFDTEKVGRGFLDDGLRNIAAGITGKNIVGYGVLVCKQHDFFSRIDAERLARQKDAALLLDHMSRGEPDFLWAIGAAEHTRPYARIIVVR